MFAKRKRSLDATNSESSNPEKHKKHWTEMSSNCIFVLWGLFMHLILLWGVLDVNFHSPIIRGLPIVPAPSEPPAKRLLLFVADGLRFQTFIEKPPPYLRYLTKFGLIIQEQWYIITLINLILCSVYINLKKKIFFNLLTAINLNKIYLNYWFIEFLVQYLFYFTK